MSHGPITDPIFGELSWDEKHHWWRGRVALTPKHTIDVDIDWDEEVPIEELLEVCRDTYQQLRQNEYAHRMKIATELFELAGPIWSDLEIREETPASVARKIWVWSVTLYGDGASELWYLDEDNLFPHNSSIHSL